MASAPYALPPRPRFDWHLRTRTLALGPRTRIMAILNVTPDSFSDGGSFLSPDQAITHALQLLDAGADILDIGGESTRPNATPVTPEQEQARILPIIEAILKARPQTILSIDTFHAATARLAVESGAEIVNDVSGHTWDPAMAATCAQLACGVVLMHARGTPQTWHTLPPLPPGQILPTVLSGLRESLTAAHTAGTPSNKILLDPGFGFGKLGDDNYVLHAQFAHLHQLGRPLLSGTSRKGFLRKTLLQLPSVPESLLYATTASNTAAILAGAHVLRVHDVPAAIAAAAIADSILHVTNLEVATS